MSIIIATSSPVLEFAAGELTRAFKLLDAPDIELTLCAGESETDGFAVDVNFPAGSGFIKGSNPRSVLFACYAFLQKLGFAWPRPGKDGEVIPPPPEKWEYIRFYEQADTPCRGCGAEGAYSRENLLDFIDWMPKVRLNTLFLETHNFLSFERWYSHQGNPLAAAEKFDANDIRRAENEARKELAKRGLMFQCKGHGALEESWADDPEGLKKHYALVNGKRSQWHGRDVYTQLCYSDPEVRSRFVRRVVEWAQENPDAAVMHVWLSDHHHNHCECPACVIQRPSDWYVTMLNEADRALREAGFKGKIAFVVYYETLWPPVKVKFEHPEHFILYFCPVSRTYSESLFSAVPAGKIPEFLRNISPFPASPAENLAFIEEWKKVFDGEYHIFDYHYMWDVHKDHSSRALAEVIHADAVRMNENGFSGLVNCMNLRAFFPTALGMNAMAAGLWDNDSQFEDVEKEYFRQAYGEGFMAAMEYFRQVQIFFPVRVLRGETAPVPIDRKVLTQLVQAVQPAIAAGKNSGQAAVRRSWRQLELHCEELELVCGVLDRAYAGDTAGKIRCAGELFNWARKHEAEEQPYFDVYEYIMTLIPAMGLSSAREELFKASGSGDLGAL